MTEVTPPIRLIDDPNLDASLRSDLARTQARAPLSYDVQAGLARFERTLASPAGGTALGGAAALRVLGWLLGASVLLGGSIGAVDLVQTPRHERPSVALAPRIDIEPEDAPVAGMSSSVLREPVAEVEAEHPASATTGEAAALDVPEAPRPATKPKADTPALSPADEATRINEARNALAHDPGKTLALVEALERELPDGAMIEERRGYAILALLALGRTQEAEQRADSYLQRWPNGPLSRRIRDALGR